MPNLSEDESESLSIHESKSLSLHQIEEESDSDEVDLSAEDINYT